MVPAYRIEFVHQVLDSLAKDVMGALAQAANNGYVKFSRWINT